MQYIYMILMIPNDSIYLLLYIVMYRISLVHQSIGHYLIDVSNIYTVTYQLNSSVI